MRNEKFEQWFQNYLLKADKDQLEVLYGMLCVELHERDALESTPRNNPLDGYSL